VDCIDDFSFDNEEVDLKTY